MPNQTFFNLPKEKQERIMDSTIKELGLHTFEHINLSNIVRDSGIPRGSFYQYFKDKDDLYLYFNQYIGKMKYDYWGDLFSPDLEIPFLDRYYQICLKGFTFAKLNPTLMKAGQKMMDSDYFKNNPMTSQAMNNATQLFSSLIKRDQEKGYIKSAINPDLVSSILLDFMGKVTMNEYLNNDINLDVIQNKIEQLINIIRKGIE